jgi:hypothetical protein
MKKNAEEKRGEDLQTCHKMRLCGEGSTFEEVCPSSKRYIRKTNMVIVNRYADPVENLLI